MHILNDFYNEYKNRFNIFIIYITEAHAVDVWNIGESAGTINFAHKTIDDRIKCGIKFRDTFKLDVPIYCDNMENEAETYFSGWPFRYYTIDKNKNISNIGQPDDSHFDMISFFSSII